MPATIDDVPACFCGKVLDVDPAFVHGRALDGRILEAGICTVHGLVSTDQDGPPVVVLPLIEALR